MGNHDMRFFKTDIIFYQILSKFLDFPAKRLAYFVFGYLCFTQGFYNSLKGSVHLPFYVVVGIDDTFKNILILRNVWLKLTFLIDTVQNKFRGIYVARTKSLEYEKTCHVLLMHGKFKGIPDHEVCKPKQQCVSASHLMV